MWYDAAIDGVIRDQLAQVAKTPLIRAFEKAGKRLPIDYMGPGFGGNAHRVKSAGHDLSRPITALRQILEGRFEGVVWSFGEKSTVIVGDRFDVVTSVEEALLRWMMHLSADFLTPMSLPIPGFSRLHDSDSHTLSQFAKAAYKGMRPGEGLNLRSAIAAPGLTTIATELVLRTYVHASALHARGTPVLNSQEQRKRAELQLAAHSLVGAASLGKAVTQALISPHPTPLHPAHLRHVNIPTLVMMGKSAVRVTSDYLTARQAAAPRWDDLLLATAQPWQLDLACEIETAWTVGHDYA